jgi:N-acetylmuramoyl-L-alanine amidase
LSRPADVVNSAIQGETTEAKTRRQHETVAQRLGLGLAAVAGVWMILAAAPGFASLRHEALAGKAWSLAVKLQQNLEAKPARHRTRAEYERVIREYRQVYFYDFAYVKAPVAAETMGDLSVEMGRLFHNSADFQSAIEHYQYVVSQYPGSSMARDSALAIGNAYLEGLNDPDQATEAYRALLEKYPASPQSSEARKKLKEIAGMQAARQEQESAKAVRATGQSTPAGRTAGGPVEVTEIHKWVGPSFTRVVIGAQGPFQYNTLRLSHPDRIVFDLPNTHVTRELLAKNVRVNGAYLQDIRVGQFKPNVTRIVLDVKDISDYSAFPLPNPFRLIIDVHGSSTETAGNVPEHGKLPARAAARTEPIEQVPAEEKASTGKQTPASAEEKASAVKQTPTSPPKAEADRSGGIEEVANRKSGGAIEFPDQQAAMAMAEAKSSHHAGQGAKKQPQAASDHSVQQPAAPKTELAFNPHMEKPAKPQAGAASSSHDREAVNQTEAAPSRPVPHAAKRRVEVASTETSHNPFPISAKPASPTENGSQTLTRALGLKVARIVIDPGHGGFDTGTIGPSGLEEKNIVLDIGLRLRKLIETQTNSEVFMTRSTDKFVPLEERTAIANEDGADLFISIHANASRDHHVRGIETYFLNFTSDPEALRLAARENATSQESVHQLQNLIQKIALNNKIEESQELARDIQSVLYKRMSRVSRGIHNRGVRKAPFVVLIGANMPSVLAEISFLSNSHSEHLLRDPAYREQIARALFRGVENYTNNLGSVRVAQRTQ